MAIVYTLPWWLKFRCLKSSPKHTHDIPSVHGSGAIGLKTVQSKTSRFSEAWTANSEPLSTLIGIAAMAQRGPGSSTPRGAVSPRGTVTPIGGAFGMTPAPSPAATPGGQQQPQQTGISPTAKRPLDRAQYQAMETGNPQRNMSTDELTAGFYQVAGRQDIDGRFTQGIAECVHSNAELLNESIARIIAIEANMKLTQDVIEKEMKKAEDTDKKIYAEATKLDTQLRGELNAMAIRLEDGHGELRKLIDQAAAVNTKVPPDDGGNGQLADGLRSLEARLAAFGEQLTAQDRNLQKTADQQNGRISTLE